ncbi:uncharacterized protein LOC114630497 [Grammomys surdaster]|uniref:uncharacterized protein LOC114630497 n=1 Tax=Grammomys surdaster TaxID=491861 RepID=UPI00109FC429|nr:uncharacterized protein LOC114630497 [Grammomys surdaster]
MFWSSVLKSLLAACVIMEFAVIFVESFTCASSLCVNGDCQISATCETSKGCFNQTQELNMPEPSRNLIFHQQGCSPDECTELTFSATLGDQRTFRYDQRCYAADTYNQADTQSSQVPAETNGVQCLACYMEAGMLCIPTLLECTGNETKCVSFIGTDAGSNSPPSVVMIGAGCGTESACNLNMTILKTVNIHSFCSSGSSSHPICLFMGVTMSWFLVLKSLLAGCIISLLSISSVESYGCIRKTCFGEQCNHEPSTCESSKGCFSQRQGFEFPIPQAIEQSGCSEDSCTELAFSATLGRCRTFRYDRRCCFTDQCNQGSIKVSPLSSDPNGVECPACFSDRGRCSPVSLKCTGEETMCVEVTGRAGTRNQYPVKIHSMGCATRTACNLRNMTILDDIQISTSCVSGSPVLRPILSVLTSLFLMKALL